VKVKVKVRDHLKVQGCLFSAGKGRKEGRKEGRSESGVVVFVCFCVFFQ